METEAPRRYVKRATEFNDLTIGDLLAMVSNLNSQVKSLKKEIRATPNTSKSESLKELQYRVIRVYSRLRALGHSAKAERHIKAEAKKTKPNG